MSEQLDPTGGPVQIGRMVMYTPGLTGVATWYPALAPGMRGIGLSTDALDQALRETNLEVMDTVAISGAQEIGMSTATTRSTGFGEPAMVLETPDPGPSWGQVVLTVDEDGVMTWEHPVTSTGALDTTRGAGTLTYVMRRRVPKAPAGASPHRGLLGQIGTKLLKVLVFKLLDPIGGALGDYFVGKWETKKRPYRIRSFAPSDYRNDVSGSVSWAQLSAGRALLMLHGSFSRAHSAFYSMPNELVQDLHNRYGGRMLAFDHFTASEDPIQNVKWFLSQVPDGTNLDLDIVCHSRGGLVARSLAELQPQLALSSRKLRIRKIVFVASPNAGTPLADPQHMGDFIDTYTNLLQLLPDNPYTDTLEYVITVLKQLTVGALRGLEGLQAMNPDGPFLKMLNRGPTDAERHYYAIAANYEPRGGLGDYAKDRLMDAVFDQVDNDLVVPTLSAYGKNGSGMFPLTDRFVLPAVAGIQHTNFFGDARVAEQLRTWLLPQ